MNYIGAIVDILETPKQKIVKDNLCVTEFRARLAQPRKTQIVHLVVLGNLADNLANYYNVNDSILVEGYVSVSPLSNSKSNQEFLNKIKIIVLKIYPLLSNSNQFEFGNY